MLIFLFVALCSFVVSALLSFLFCMCRDARIVVALFGGCPLCFLFCWLCCDVILVAFDSWPSSFSVLLVVIKSGTGTQGENSRL